MNLKQKKMLLNMLDVVEDLNDEWIMTCLEEGTMNKETAQKFTNDIQKMKALANRIETD